MQLDLRCPECKKGNDRLATVNHRNRPTAGTINICFNCAAVCEFIEDGDILRLKSLPKDQVASLMKNQPEIFTILQTIREVKGMKPN